MNNRLTQLIRYSGTAGAAAIVDIGLFGVLDAISIPLVIAAALSFLVATVANYVLTARFVFRRKFSLGGYLRFLSAASVGFVLNVGTTMIAAQTFELPVLLAKTVGVGVAFFANFALNAFFVFQQQGPSNTDSATSED